MPQGLVWRDVVAADVRHLAAGPPARIDCWYAAARLFDTSHRALVEGLIRAAPRDQIAANASLSYVAACMAENEGRLSDALCHFADAWSLRSPDDFRLTARVVYESCFLELMRSNRMAAESIADAARAYFARSLEIVPDLELINALMADHAGNRVEAIAHHRLAIRHAANALTPATLIRAEVNLAVALEHVEPSEAVALCEHALRSLESEGLDARIRPGILNVYAYALLCATRPVDAQVILTDAEVRAASDRSTRVGLQLAFNRAITLELVGDRIGALEMLSLVRDQSRRAGFIELTSWACLRAAWLQSRLGDHTAARGLLVGQLGRVPTSLRDACDTLEGILLTADGALSRAVRVLGRVLDSYLGKGDELNAFVTLLWLAHVYRSAGRTGTAKKVVRRAFAIGRRRGFRSSPNWWADEILTSARALTDEHERPYAMTLVAPPPGTGIGPTVQRVAIGIDGMVSVAGEALPLSDWRRGRTGAFVLRRLLGSLARSYPLGLRREELADQLWPESDGDVAIRNLYGAISDLRRVLMSVPGVRLANVERSYAVELDANAAIVSQCHEQGRDTISLRRAVQEGRSVLALQEPARPSS